MFAKVSIGMKERNKLSSVVHRWVELIDLRSSGVYPSTIFPGGTFCFYTVQNTLSVLYMYIDTTSGIGTRTEYAPNRIPDAVFRIIHIKHTAMALISNSQTFNQESCSKVLTVCTDEES